MFSLLSGCAQNSNLVNERGILVLDAARNDTSFDIFIPCDINDTIPLGKIVEKMKQRSAYSVNCYRFQFAIMRTAWTSSADSFYVQRNRFRPQYISAVELTLEKDYDAEGHTISDMQIAGSITVNKILPGRYKVASIKKILLPE